MDMERRKKVRLVGMALSEKNREYFVYRLKNIRHLPLFKPTKLPGKTNE